MPDFGWNMHTKASCVVQDKPRGACSGGRSNFLHPHAKLNLAGPFPPGGAAKPNLPNCHASEFRGRVARRVWGSAHMLSDSIKPGFYRRNRSNLASNI